MNAKKFVFGGFALTLLAAVSASGSAVAAGNLVTGATAITTTITADFKLNGDKFDLETGKYYNWTIKCDARCDNLQFGAHLLFTSRRVNVAGLTARSFITASCQAISRSHKKL